MQSDGEDGTFVGRVPTGCQRCHENRLHSDCEDGHFVGRVQTVLTGCPKSTRVVHLEKIEILSEEFQQGVERMQGQSTLRKWRSCRKSSDRMSKSPGFAFQPWVGSSTKPLDGHEI